MKSNYHTCGLAGSLWSGSPADVRPRSIRHTARREKIIRTETLLIVLASALLMVQMLHWAQNCPAGEQVSAPVELAGGS